MEHRYFGRTGVRVSPLCLGCMMFGGSEPNKPSLDESCRIIDHFLDRGGNFLDTANVYATGRSEQFVGEALHRNGHRAFAFLATKCHGNMHKAGAGDPPTTDLHARLNPNQWGNSRRQVIEQCEASLRRLRTDYIDLYQIHRPHVDCPIDETLRALDDLVRSGKIRYFGTSTFAAWQVTESLWCSERLALNRTVSEQPPYHLLDRRVERELVPMARTHGLALIPWSPLAGGLLSGKYTRDNIADAAGRWKGGTHNNRKLDDRAFTVLDQLAELAAAKGCTVSQLALAWNMAQPGITSPIIGPRTYDQLVDNLGAWDVTVTDDDRKQLDAVSPPGRAIVPYYEATFGPTARW